MKVIDVVMRLRDNVSGGLTKIIILNKLVMLQKGYLKAWLKLAKAFMR